MKRDLQNKKIKVKRSDPGERKGTGKKCERKRKEVGRVRERGMDERGKGGWEVIWVCRFLYFSVCLSAEPRGGAGRGGGKERGRGKGERVKRGRGRITG